MIGMLENQELRSAHCRRGLTLVNRRCAYRLLCSLFQGFATAQLHLKYPRNLFNVSSLHLIFDMITTTVLVLREPSHTTWQRDIGDRAEAIREPMPIDQRLTHVFSSRPASLSLIDCGIDFRVRILTRIFQVLRSGTQCGLSATQVA